MGGTRGEMLVQNNHVKGVNIQTMANDKYGEAMRTYESSVSSPLSGVSLPTSVLLYFIGEFDGRRFSLGPLCGGLPSFIGGVGSGLDRFLGRHGIEIRTEVVVDDSMKAWR